MLIWSKIKAWLSESQKVILLYVIDSKGSSPGRRGFKMAINEQHEMAGSIGGGIMEHKLIEVCKEDLLKNDFMPFIKRQIHQTNIETDKSGMICSGEQTIAFYALDTSQIKMIDRIAGLSTGILTLDNTGVHFDSGTQKERFNLNPDADSWSLKEDIGHPPVLHIVGGGHVGLALSRFANDLGFAVKIYDDRDGLNTVDQNRFAECILIADYSTIENCIPNGTDDYVVLMSFGYRTDKVILQQLITKPFKYLGMMGSREKVKKLFDDLMDEGATKEQLDDVHSPIGIQISSKTPEEIAISILAEIIMVKNG